MTRSELEKLPTKRLLARLDRLRRCEESLAFSDRVEDEYTPSGFIEFKDSPEWISEYNCLKELLAEREHIPRSNKRRKNVHFETLTGVKHERSRIPRT